MKKYFIITVSKDHADMGKKYQFIQQMYENRIKQINKGDIVILYSSKQKYQTNEKYQKIVHLCQAVDNKYEKIHDLGKTYYKKKMKFKPFEEKNIYEVIDKLSFIKNKKKWGFYFLSGFRQISEQDFSIIVKNHK